MTGVTLTTCNYLRHWREEIIIPGVWELLTSQPHLCAQQDRGAGPAWNYVRWLETADTASPRANHAPLIWWLPMMEWMHQGTVKGNWCHFTAVKPLILSLPVLLLLNRCGFNGWTIRCQGIVWLQPKSYQCWVVSPQGSVWGPVVFNIFITDR